MKIDVFCGSSYGNEVIFEQKSREFGEWIARQGHTLIYGGAFEGLMGATAKGVLDQGGKAIGILPKLFWDLDEEKHPEGYSCIRVEDLEERKKVMLEQADAFVVLPGGIGTLDEMFYVLAHMQLYGNVRPCILYDINGFFQPMRTFFVDMLFGGFVREKHLDNLLISDDLKEIEEFLNTFPKGSDGE